MACLIRQSRAASSAAQGKSRHKNNGAFSEFHETIGNDADAGHGEQGIDNGTQPVMTAIQAFVRQQPSVRVFNHAADFPKPGAVLGVLETAPKVQAA